MFNISTLFPFIAPSGLTIGPAQAVTYATESVLLLPLSAVNLLAVSFDSIFTASGLTFPGGVVTLFPPLPIKVA